MLQGPSSRQTSARTRRIDQQNVRPALPANPHTALCFVNPIAFTLRAWNSGSGSRELAALPEPAKESIACGGACRPVVVRALPSGARAAGLVPASPAHRVLESSSSSSAPPAWRPRGPSRLHPGAVPLPTVWIACAEGIRCRIAFPLCGPTKPKIKAAVR